MPVLPEIPEPGVNYPEGLQGAPALLAPADLFQLLMGWGEEAEQIPAIRGPAAPFVPEVPEVVLPEVPVAALPEVPVAALPEVPVHLVGVEAGPEVAAQPIEGARGAIEVIDLVSDEEDKENVPPKRRRRCRGKLASHIFWWFGSLFGVWCLLCLSSFQTDSSP